MKVQGRRRRGVCVCGIEVAVERDDLLIGLHATNSHRGRLRENQAYGILQCQDGYPEAKHGTMYQLRLERMYGQRY